MSAPGTVDLFPGGRCAVVLTVRERQVAVLVADGVSRKQIAVRLGVSQRTVRAHVERIHAKLGGRGRPAAVICKAMWHGRIDERRGTA
jgi:DNA-binding CsgD family transcriptional regulator